MVHALLLALALQAPDASPVRVWLGSGPTAAPGAAVRVYVQTNVDGNLIVLHARPDGSVEILFPSDPSADPFVRAGTYEIRGAGDGASFIAAGSQGVGMVLAALSPDQLWVDGFVRRGTWDVAERADSDPEGALTDIVQRMLGDGSFNYDLTGYDVAPRSNLVAETVAPPPSVDSCVGCGFTQIVIIDGSSRFSRPRHRAVRHSDPPAAATSTIAAFTPRPPAYVPPAVTQSSPANPTAPRKAIPLRYRRRSSDASLSDLARSRALVRPTRPARPDPPAIASVMPRATSVLRAAVAPGAPRQSATSLAGAPATIRYSAQPSAPGPRAAAPVRPAAPSVPSQPGTFAVSHPPTLPFYQGRR